MPALSESPSGALSLEYKRKLLVAILFVLFTVYSLNRIVLVIPMICQISIQFMVNFNLITVKLRVCLSYLICF